MISSVGQGIDPNSQLPPVRIPPQFYFAYKITKTSYQNHNISNKSFRLVSSVGQGVDPISQMTPVRIPPQFNFAQTIYAKIVSKPQYIKSNLQAG